MAKERYKGMAVVGGGSWDEGAVQDGGGSHGLERWQVQSSMVAVERAAKC